MQREERSYRAGPAPTLAYPPGLCSLGGPSERSQVGPRRLDPYTSVSVKWAMPGGSEQRRQSLQGLTAEGPLRRTAPSAPRATSPSRRGHEQRMAEPAKQRTRVAAPSEHMPRYLNLDSLQRPTLSPGVSAGSSLGNMEVRQGT